MPHEDTMACRQRKDRDTVLMVDDNPTNLQVLQATLEGEGYRLLAARDGASALAVSAKAEPDLILLDIMMPGMDGYEICEQVKANPETAHTYIIMVSAKTQVEDRRRAALAGADEYVTKPFDIAHVMDRVGAALNVKAV